jgi:hypothetical protein
MYKVFAGWYGGYAGSDSWKLSSGIEKSIEHDDYYEIHNNSGSVYKCYKTLIGQSIYMHSIFSQFKENCEKNNASFCLLVQTMCKNKTKKTSHYCEVF